MKAVHRIRALFETEFSSIFTSEGRVTVVLAGISLMQSTTSTEVLHSHFIEVAKVNDAVVAISRERYDHGERAVPLWVIYLWNNPSDLSDRASR